MAGVTGDYTIDGVVAFNTQKSTGNCTDGHFGFTMKYLTGHAAFLTGSADFFTGRCLGTAGATWAAKRVSGVGMLIGMGTIAGSRGW